MLPSLEAVFRTVLNMTVTGSMTAAVLLLARIPLRRAPRSISYALWAVLGLRLCCPFSFSLPVSLPGLLGGRAVTEGASVQYFSAPPASIPGGAPAGVLAAPAKQAAVWNWWPVLTLLWLAGAAALLCYSIFTYRRLLRRVRTATLLEGNLYECEFIQTPFVCGLVRPRIYLPLGLGCEQRRYAVAHERVHLRRGDHLLKPLAFLILLLHWFNPLVWLCFALFTDDMERSCDEAVLRGLDEEQRTGYSAALLQLATGGPLWTGSPLHFGEGSLKGRIRGILNYRRPAFCLVLLALLLAAALGVFLCANPLSGRDAGSTAAQPWDGRQLEALLEGRTPYVGDAPAVVALIDNLPMPSGAHRGWVQLRTDTAPYGVEIAYSLEAKDGIFADDTLQSEPFFRGAAVLLSLVDNLDSVTFHLEDNCDYPGAVYRRTYTRAEVEAALGSGLSGFSQSVQGLETLLASCSSLDEGSPPLGEAQAAALLGLDGGQRAVYLGSEQLLDRLCDVFELTDSSGRSYGREAFSRDGWSRLRWDVVEERWVDVYAEDIYLGPDGDALLVDQFLSTILESPASSSNPADYLNAHPSEAETLVEMDVRFLRVAFARFAAGGQNDLHGALTALLCEEILGDEALVGGEPVSHSTGQEWYDRYREALLAFGETHGSEALREQYPRGSLLLG